MRRGATAALAASLLAFALGCGWWNIRTVTVTTINDGDARISDIEVDYAGGSYGIAALAPGEKHTRAIRFRGDSPLSYSYRDAANQKHSFKEGAFHLGSSGRAVVRIGANGTVRFEYDFAR